MVLLLIVLEGPVDVVFDFTRVSSVVFAVPQASRTESDGGRAASRNSQINREDSVKLFSETADAYGDDENDSPAAIEASERGA